MEDVGKVLQKELVQQFKMKLALNPEVKMYREKLKKGNIQQKEGSIYMGIISECAARTVCEIITEKKLPGGKLYWNIAMTAIVPYVQFVCDYISKTMRAIWECENNKECIPIKFQTCKYPEKRLQGLLNQWVNKSLKGDVGNE